MPGGADTIPPVPGGAHHDTHEDQRQLGASSPHAPQSQCHHCLNVTREPWSSATGKPGTHGEKNHQNSAYIYQHPVVAPIVNLSVLAWLVSLPASMVWPPVNPSCES